MSSERKTRLGPVVMTIGVGAALYACTQTPVASGPATPATSATPVAQPVTSAPPAVASTQPAVASPAPTPFPFPAGLSEPDTEICKVAESRVKAGLALLDQVWLAATCVLHRVPEEKRAEYAAQVQAFRDAASTKAASGTISGSALPEPLKADQQENGGDLNQKVDVFVADARLREELKAVFQPHLGMGSWRGICLPWQDKAGHSDVTRQALTAIEAAGSGRFSSAAEDVLADASQDADFFAWLDMAAHAQTDSDKNGRPKNPQQAQDAFLGWVKRGLDKAKAACAEPGGSEVSLKKALYWTGYSVHALQDLAPHRGRTNPEHSFNAKQGHNPDVGDDAIALAKDLTVRYLSQALANSLKPCAAKFATYNGGAVTPFFKVGDLGLRYDNSPASLLEYKASASLFEKIKDEPKVKIRWFGPVDGSPKTTCEADADCKKLFAKVPK